jgi:hypothetical protein
VAMASWKAQIRTREFGGMEEKSAFSWASVS